MLGMRWMLAVVALLESSREGQWQVKGESFSRTVSQGRDDAEESNLSYLLDGFDIELGVDDPNRGNMKMGYRFRDIPIPKGARIESATLRLTARFDSGSGIPFTNIMGDDADDSIVFSNNQLDRIRPRAKTTNKVRWNVPRFFRDNAVTSPNFAAVVQEIVDRSGWKLGNAMMIIIENIQGSNNSPRKAYSFEGTSQSSRRARLSVTYTIPTAAPTNPPTRSPTTLGPTRSPTRKPTSEPTISPTLKPTEATPVTAPVTTPGTESPSLDDGNNPAENSDDEEGEDTGNLVLAGVIFSSFLLGTVVVSVAMNRKRSLSYFGDDIQIGEPVSFQKESSVGMPGLRGPGDLMNYTPEVPRETPMHYGGQGRPLPQALPVSFAWNPRVIDGPSPPRGFPNISAEQGRPPALPPRPVRSPFSRVSAFFPRRSQAPPGQ
mmetsp:Transcript_22425/g.42020  ORF Transcript_22425/g.42020 Transcript_22425/m.42020 type:complete len:433 (+) Transcript_22425:182-1480(+)